MADPSYVAVKKSQVPHFNATPLFKKTKEDGFVLYKSENEEIDIHRFADDRYPQLFIEACYQERAVEELRSQLRSKLKTAIKSGELNTVKSALIDIVSEVVDDATGTGLSTLPETIDIIYDEYQNTTDILTHLPDIQSGGHSLVEHSINVMVYTLNCSLFCRFGEAFTKNISLGALIHDIGLTRIPRKIITLDRKLTDKEFAVYKAHPAIGHDLIKERQNFHPSISTGVLEHHERLDGNGYPRGIANLSIEGRILGLVDSFDQLVSSEKADRKIKKPFDAMSLIKREVLVEGRFDKAVFKDLCLSLSGKGSI